jgi:general secretion pathway protein G
MLSRASIKESDPKSIFHVIRPPISQWHNRVKNLLRRTKNFRKKKYGGFTLVELIMIMAIMGTISGIAVPFYSSYIDKARIFRTISEIRLLEKEIAVYKETFDALPLTLNDIGRGSLKDPWGNPYQYLNFTTIEKGKDEGEEKGKGKGKDEEDDKGKARKDRFLHPLNTDYDLYSMGKDGDSKIPLTANASRDDIIRANDGEYVGIASMY